MVIIDYTGKDEGGGRSDVHLGRKSLAPFLWVARLLRDTGPPKVLAIDLDHTPPTGLLTTHLRQRAERSGTPTGGNYNEVNAVVCIQSVGAVSSARSVYRKYHGYERLGGYRLNLAQQQSRVHVQRKR